MNNTTWKTQGLCYGHPNPDLWFPSIDRRQKRTTAIQAQQICARCPVTEECADYANRNDERHGVWAGINRYGTPKPARLEPPHGTDARAKRHRRAGETPCGPCLEAERVALRMRKLRRRAS